MSQADGSIIIDTKIDQAGLSSGLDKMKSAVKVGVTAVVAAIGAMSAAVVSLGSEFEQANAKASTLFGDAQVDMSQYQGKMLDLSTKTGIAASELGNTMYDALSAGIPASDDMSESLGFLEKNSKLAKAGFTDVNTATTATAKVLNAYKMDVGETDRVHKVLMATQNKGITTVNELGSVLSQVTPTAAAMNVSFEQVGAALANMTAQGTPTAQATTQLNQLFAELGKSGTTANKALMEATEGTKHAGKSFQDLMKEGVPLNEIINLMADSAENSGLSLLDMFSSIEGGKAALSVSGKNTQQYTDNLNEMSTSVDLVGDAYEKVTDTFKEKSTKVINSLKNVGIAAYSKFEKPLKKSMDVAQSSVDGLSKNMANGKLGKSVDTIAEGFGELIEVTAELAANVIPMLIDGFAFVIDNGKAVTTVLVGIAAATIYYKNQEVLLNTVQAVSMGLKTGLAVASLAYEAAQIALAGGLGGVAAAQAAVNTVMTLCPINWTVVAVGALAAGITALCLTMDDETNKYKEKNEEINNNVAAYDELKKKQEENITTNLAEIDHNKRLSNELMNLVDSNGKVKKGYEDRVQFIIGELNTAFGTEYSMTDGVIGKYDELRKSITDLIAVQRAQIILEGEKEAYNQAMKDRTSSIIELNNLEKEYAETKIENDAKIIELQSERDEALRRGDEITLESSISKINALTFETETMGKSLESQRSLVGNNLMTIAQFEADAAAVKSGNVDAMSAMNARYASSYVENGKTINLELEQRLAVEKSNLESLQSKRDEASNISDVKQREYTVKALDIQIQSSQDQLDQMMLSNGKGLSEYGTYIQNKLSRAEELKTGLNNKEKGITKDMVTEAQKQSVQSLAEFGNYVNGKNSKAIDLKRRLDSNEKGITKDMVKEAQNQATQAAKEFEKVSKNVTDAMDDLPKDTKTIFSNMVTPMYDEMDKAKPNLWDKAKSIADGILGNLAKAFDVHSPSRKTRALFKNVMLGAELGLDDEKEHLFEKTDNISSNILDMFQGIDLSQAFDTIKQAIYAEQMKMAAVVNTQAKIEIMKTNMMKQETGSIAATVNGQQVIKLIIDSREMAVTLAPLISEELAFKKT